MTLYICFYKNVLIISILTMLLVIKIVSLLYQVKIPHSFARSSGTDMYNRWDTPAKRLNRVT